MTLRNNKSDKLFDKVNETMYELIKMDNQTARDLISETGLDPQSEVDKGIKWIKQLKFKAQAIENKKSDEALLEKALVMLKDSIKQNLVKPGSDLIELLKKQAPSVQFRSLDKLGDDDIREILNDVDLARVLEELEKEKDNE